MSKLSLDSFVCYKPGDRQTPFYPEPRAVKNRDGRQVVVLGDVPLPPGIPHPRNALTCLYGFRDALEEMQRQHQLAREEGLSLIKVTFKLEVGQIVMGTTDSEKLSTTNFLNMQRLKEQLMRVVLDGINERLAAESSKSKRVKVCNSVLEAGERPDLICDVIRSEPMFSHINSVVYLVPDGSLRGRQVASIFTDEVTDLKFRGDMPFDIELPKIER